MAAPLALKVDTFSTRTRQCRRNRHTGNGRYLLGVGERDELVGVEAAVGVGVGRLEQFAVVGHQPGLVGVGRRRLVLVVDAVAESCRGRAINKRWASVVETLRQEGQGLRFGQVLGPGDGAVAVLVRLEELLARLLLAERTERAQDPALQLGRRNVAVAVLELRAREKRVSHDG